VTGAYESICIFVLAPASQRTGPVRPIRTGAARTVIGALNPPVCRVATTVFQSETLSSSFGSAIRAHACFIELSIRAAV
jgi:hypothetical protein